MQTNRVHNWPTICKHMTTGSWFKAVDDIGMAKDFKANVPWGKFVVRFWRDWMQQFDNDRNSTRNRARQFIETWLNDPFREMAQYIDAVEDFNEYWAASHTPEETAMRILWVEQVLWVWNNEVMRQPENSGLKHIRWCLGNAAVGNDIPWQVAKMAFDGDHYIGYHGYISIASRDLPKGMTAASIAGKTHYTDDLPDVPYRETMRLHHSPNQPYPIAPYYPKNIHGHIALEALGLQLQANDFIIPGERSPGEFIWGSGRILQQDTFEFQPRGIYPEYIITEGGPIRDANGRGQLMPNDGWRHKNCENGSIDRYLRHTKEVYEQYHEWNKHNGNRMLGYTDFTLGIDNWPDFLIGAGDLEVMLIEIQEWPDDEIAPPPPPTPPSLDYAHGMDISSNNFFDQNSSFFLPEKAKDQGVIYIFLRASEGWRINDASPPNEMLDPDYVLNTEIAINAGLLVGSYHLFRPDMPTQTQVNDFISQVRSTSKQHLPPVLDLEKAPDLNKMTQDLWHLKVLSWLEEVEIHLGIQPMIYSNKSFYDTWLNTEEFDKYDFWIANYTKGSQPYLPLRRETWDFWQYSAGGNGLGKEYGVESGDVDLNHFNGTSEALVKLWGHNWLNSKQPPIVKPTNLRVEYDRVVLVIPPNATPAQQQAIIDIGIESQNSFMFSYDDAGATPVENNTAELYGIANTQKENFKDWFAYWYPKTKVIFRDLP